MRFLRISTGVFALAASGLSVFACGDGGKSESNEPDDSSAGGLGGALGGQLNEPTGMGCSADEHCPADMDCLAGECVSVLPCASSKDCRVDQVCDTSSSRCVECIGNNDCTGGAICHQYSCATPCTTDKNCTPEGKVCEIALGVCVECRTEADCAQGQECSAGGSCVSSMSPGGTGGSGDGDGDGCHPSVSMLIQRSGAMFELPNPAENWWNAVSDALDQEGDDLLDQYASSMTLSVSTFHMVSADSTCPLIATTEGPVGPGGLAAFLNEQEDAHLAHVEAESKVDAPLPEAIAQAVSALGGTGERYLLLVVTGMPDSCTEQDGICQAEPSILALQQAHAAGVVAKVLYLPSSGGVDSYPQALANAGAGEGVAVEETYAGCETTIDVYSDTPGSAPYQSPSDAAAVASSLGQLLSEISTCN